MALITYLTRIHFADNVVADALRTECRALGIRRPLVVTDKGVAAAGLLQCILDALPADIEVTLFDETPENPTEQAVDAATEIYMQAECDGVIALGGGSPVDLAKATGLMATHEGSLASYAAINGGAARIKDVMPPLVAIPTTAGTGSEVGRGAIIVLNDGRKLGLISPFLVPSVAICDPVLTVSLPPRLTAGTGMDALTHCVETYIATAYNPPADGIALEGLRRAHANVRRAVEDGRDIEARREMMAAALNGALAFQKGLGGVHAMSHALGGLPGYRLHHGVLNAILLPHVLRFNAPAVGHRYGALNRAMGLPEEADTAAELQALSEAIGLPTRLSALGADRAAIDAAAPLAETDHTNGTNPRRASAADYYRLMSEAL